MHHNGGIPALGVQQHTEGCGSLFICAIPCFFLTLGFGRGMRPMIVSGRMYGWVIFLYSLLSLVCTIFPLYIWLLF